VLSAMLVYFSGVFWIFAGLVCEWVAEGMIAGRVLIGSGWLVGLRCLGKSRAGCPDNANQCAE
jgi:hypothetical protein